MTGENPASERERRVNRAIAEYLEAERLGRAPDREDWLRLHPDLADELRSFFADRDSFGRLAEPVGPQAAPVAAPEAQTLAPGETAATGLGTVRYFGDYELLEEIARGGMGVVYRARQVSLGRTVAVKMILAGQLASPEDVQRFRREAEAAANLDHSNIVPIYEVGEHEGQHFFSMKLVERGSLAGRAMPLPARQAAVIVAAVARAVHHAHQRGVLHRDLKPGNILLDAQGQPHVTDFGLARRVEGDAGHTRTGSVVGTPSYMPPEQARAEKGLTTAVDVYGLGAVLYELLTGRPPFRAETPLDTLLQVLEREPEPPRKLNPRIDRDLDTVCLKCLEKDPQRRYDSAAALADDLQRFLDGKPIQARPVGRGERVVRWFRRNPALGAAASLAVLALLAATGMSIAYALDRSAYAADRAGAAQRLEELNGALQTEGANKRAEAERAKAALRETNRILATVAVDRAQRQHQGGETGQALLQLVEAIRFAREAGDAGLERNARSTIGLWQGEVHRLRSVLPPPKPAEVKIDHAIGNSGWVRGTSNYPFNDVALSADGRAAVVWSYPEARVIDPVTGRLLGPPLKGHTRIEAMGISPDGKTVALDDIIDNRPGTATQRITCWDVASGKALGSPIQYTVVIEKYGKTLVFSPDGKTLAIGDEGGNVKQDVGGRLVEGAAHVRRWDVASGKEIGAALGNEFMIHAVAWSPDARLMAVGNGSTFRVWDIASGRPVGGEMKAAALELVFSPDGKTLLTPGSNGAYLWDVATGRQAGSFDAGDGDVQSVAFSENGKQILTGSATGVVRLWDVATRKPLGPPMMHGSLVREVAFRQGDPAIVAAQADATIRTWEPAGTDASEVAWKSGWHSASQVTIPLAFDPAGQTLLTAGEWGRENLAKCWDARTGALRARFAHGPGARVVSVAVSPDGKTGLTACWSHGPPGKAFDIGSMHILTEVPKGEIFRWDLAKGTSLGRLVEVPEEVMNATFVRGGQAVLVISAADANAPTTLRLFDATSGKAIGPPVPLGNHRAEPVAVGPDGRRAVSGQGFGQPAPQLWDATTGQPIGSPLADAGQVSAVAFSPDGTVFATAAGNLARFWDAATGAPLCPPMVHKGGIGAVAFSPDGKALLTSCNLADHSGQVAFWDVPSGQSILPPRTFPHPVDAIAFRPDGKAVAAVSDGEIRVWPVAVPATDDVERLRLRFQVWTGMELRDVVGYQALDPDTWLRRKQELDGAGSKP